MNHMDLGRVECVADIVHPNYPEDAAVFAERLRLYPAGCLALEFEQRIRGYAIGHPWFVQRPPALNSQLRELPGRPETFYIHDLALLPDMRGAGFGVEIVDLFVEQAKIAGLDSMSLIAVSRSLSFWHKNGFQIVDQETIRASLETYGKEAVFMERRLV